MSAFGGDSWVPEARHRKRRVDDLMLSSSSSSYKKLANGKFACLVCPHNPVLDSSLIFSMHVKGSRHITAETWLKEKELSRPEELNKRIALSGDSKDLSNSVILLSKLKGSTVNKPLIEKTRQAILETQCERISGRNVKDSCNWSVVTASSTLYGHYNSSLSYHPSQQFKPTCPVVPVNHNESIAEKISVGDSVVISDPNTRLRQLREKELRFTAAGWKRDGHGKWYRDENVEFDSDEEDPNISLG